MNQMKKKNPQNLPNQMKKKNPQNQQNLVEMMKEEPMRSPQSHESAQSAEPNGY
jgi:hypothetical protein